MVLAFRSLAMVWLLGLLAWPAFAQDSSIYSGEVAVASQDEIEREAALGRALTQVLIKASGDPTIAADPSLAEATASASSLLRSHSYRERAGSNPNTPMLHDSITPAREPGD